MPPTTTGSAQPNALDPAQMSPLDLETAVRQRLAKRGVTDEAMATDIVNRVMTKAVPAWGSADPQERAIAGVDRGVEAVVKQRRSQEMAAGGDGFGFARDFKEIMRSRGRPIDDLSDMQAARMWASVYAKPAAPMGEGRAVGIPGSGEINIGGRIMRPGDPGFPDPERLGFLQRQQAGQYDPASQVPRYPMPESGEQALTMLRDAVTQPGTLGAIGRGMGQRLQGAQASAANVMGTLQGVSDSLGGGGGQIPANAYHLAASQIREDVAGQPQSAGTVLGGVVADSVPAGLAMLAPAGAAAKAAIGSMVVGSAGDGIADYRQTMLAQGKKPNPADEALIGFGYGLTEYLFERVGIEKTGELVKNVAGNLIGAAKGGGLSSVGKAIAGMAQSVGVNMGEEAATQLAQNYIAKTYDPNRDESEGVAAAATGGGLQGALFAGVGGAGQAARMGLQSLAERRAAANLERRATEQAPKQPAVEQPQKAKTNPADQIAARMSIEAALKRADADWRQENPEPPSELPQRTFAQPAKPRPQPTARPELGSAKLNIPETPVSSALRSWKPGEVDIEQDRVRPDRAEVEAPREPITIRTPLRPGDVLVSQTGERLTMRGAGGGGRLSFTDGNGKTMLATRKSLVEGGWWLGTSKENAAETPAAAVRDPAQERDVAGGQDDTGAILGVESGVQGVVRQDRTPAGNQPGDVAEERDLEVKPDLVPDSGKMVDAGQPKQPWEMTRNEYVGEYQEPYSVKDIQEASRKAKGQRQRHNARTGAMVPPAISGEISAKISKNESTAEGMREAYRTYVDAYKRGIEDHYRSIKKALSEGKPVPASVLADYPDLSVEANKKVESPTPASQVGESAQTTPQWGIYRVRIKDYGERFAVRQSADPRGFGDTTHATIEEAQKYIKDEQEREAKNAEFRKNEAADRAKKDAKEAADKAEREDTDGYADTLPPMQRGKAIKSLNALARMGDKVDTIRNHVRALVASGQDALTTRKEPKIKPMTRLQFNRAGTREQEAHAARMREAGDKTVYLVGGVDLGRTAWEYAHTLVKKKLAEPKQPAFSALSSAASIRNVATRPGVQQPALLREWSEAISKQTDPARVRSMLEDLFVVARAENARPFGPEGLKQLLRAFPEMESPTTTTTSAEGSESPSKALKELTDVEPVVQQIAKRLQDGQGFKNVNEARKMYAEVTGKQVKPGTEDAKQADEHIEQGVVIAARETIRGGREARSETKDTYAKLVDLYQRQPNLAVRTSTSVSQQAYSTPAPLAYLASRLAGIGPQTSVYEPSAGNGMLLIDSNPERTFANELNPRRVQSLKDLRTGNVSDQDATAFLPSDKVDAVIANPPFGKVGDTRWKTPYYITDQVDHAIVFKSLEAMKDDGTAVFIVGGTKTDAEGPREKLYSSAVKNRFYKHLYDNFNVTGHFTVNGDLYSKMGASFPVDVIVIRGRGKGAKPYPWRAAPNVYNSWEELSSVIDGTEDRGTESGIRAQDQSGSGGAVRGPGQDRNEGNQPEPVSAPDGGPTDVRGKSGGRGGKSDAKRPARSSKKDTGPEQPVSEPTGTDAAVGAGVPDAGASEPDASGPGGRADDVAVRLDDSPRIGTQPRVDDAQETGAQAAYRPASKDTNAVGTLIPRNQREDVELALKTVEEANGSISTFVGRELGMNAEQLRSAFSAEQVDALALAINNIKNGTGLVLGDQTGIGKGRVVAGVLLWAKRNKLIPVFVTETANLYGDIVRDLIDIGQEQWRLAPTNRTLSGKDSVVLPDGRVLAPAPGLIAGIQKNGVAILGNGKFHVGGEEYDAIVTTYTQLQGEAAKDRKEAMLRIAPDAVLILDEAHNAGGNLPPPDSFGAQMLKSAEKKGKESRAAFIRKLVDASHGVMYSSATWAKRPGVMDLYRRTNMKDAVDDIQRLGEILGRGGIAMQQAVSQALARAGQYIRRERSFADVTFVPRVVEADKDQADKIAAVYQAIAEFDVLKAEAVENVKEDLADAAASVVRDSSTGKAGVRSTNFTSLMHNIVAQHLLASKTEAAAEAVLESVRAGEKVVIALSNTMESQLAQFAEDNGLKVGDSVSAITFADILKNYAKRSREIITENDTGSGSEYEHVWLTDQQLGAAAVAKWNQIQQLIREVPSGGLPMSPIDAIRNALAGAQITDPITGKTRAVTVREVTGRTMGVDYSGASPVLANKDKAESGNSGKRSTIDGFQSGRVDVVILNRSGSTGISLHADMKRAKDLRTRHMFILQPDPNIDVFMQMLGRVHRTGQKQAPKYTLLMSNLPGELRPAAVLARKMASLNANVQSSRSGSMQMDLPDVMNRVGDEVVSEWLNEDPALATVLDVEKLTEAPDPEDANYEPGKYVAMMTGRAALFPIKRQEDIWKELQSRYEQKLDDYRATGNNPLEMANKDYAAVTKQRVELSPATPGEPSIFTAPVTLEIAEVKSEQKSMTLKELQAEYLKRAKRDNPADAKSYWDDWRETIIAEGEKWANKQISGAADPDKVRETQRRLQESLDRGLSMFTPGSSVRLTNGDAGVVLSVEIKDGASENPMALGRYLIHVAVPDQRRQIKLSMSSQFDRNDDSKSAQSGSSDVFKKFDTAANNPTVEQAIATGNVIRAYEMLGQYSPSIIQFTRANGESDLGVIPTSSEFDVGKYLTERPREFQSVQQAVAFVRAGQGMTTPDGAMHVYRVIEDEWRFSVDRNKQRGGPYYLNAPAIKAAGQDFVGSGGRMVLDVSSLAKARAVIEAFTKQGIRFRAAGTHGAALDDAGIRLFDKVVRENPAEIKRDRRTGGYTTIFADILDLATKAVKAVAKVGKTEGAKAMRDVSKAAREFALDAGLHRDHWSKTAALARRVLNEVGENPTDAQIDAIAEDLFAQAENPKTKTERQEVAGKERAKGEKRGEVKASTKSAKEARRIYRAAKMEGMKQAEGELRDLVEKIQDAQKNMLNFRLRAQREELTTLAKDRARTLLELRREVVAIAKNLPTQIRGRFLNAAAETRTTNQLERVAQRAMRDVVAYQGREVWRQLVRVGKADNLKLLDPAMRDQARARIVGAKAAAKLLRSSKEDKYQVTVDSLKRAHDRIREAFEFVAAAVQAEKMANRLVARGRLQRADFQRQEMSAALLQRPDLKGINGADPEMTVGKRLLFANGLHFNRLMMWLDGDWSGQGPFHRVVKALIVSRRQHLHAKQRFSDRFSEIVTRHGYASLSEFLSKADGALGDASQETIGIKIGGREMTLGEAMYIYALDKETTDQTDKKVMFNFKVAREATPFRINKIVRQKIIAKLTPEQKAIVDESKALYDQSFWEGLDRVSKTLRGYHLEKVPGYWGIQRNLKKSETRDVPEGWQGSLRANLEESGILKERTGGGIPILIGSFGGEILRRSDGTAKIIAAAHPVRNAYMTILSPAVRSLIVRKFGKKMVQRIEDTLVEYAVGQREDGGLIRWLNGNASQAATQANPRSWARQIASVFTIAHKIGFDGVIRNIGAIFSRSLWREMTSQSPVLRERWSHGSYSLGTLADQFPQEVADMSSAQIAKASFRQLLDFAKKGTVFTAEGRQSGKQIDRPWRALKAKVKWGNYFDGMSALVAYSHYKKLAAKREDWSPERRQSWAIRKAEEAFQATANTNDVLHSDAYAQEGRKNAMKGMFLSFTSDIAQKRNMLAEGFGQGWRKGIRAAMTILLSALWSGAVTLGFGAGTALVGGELLGNKGGMRMDKMYDAAGEKSLAQMAGELAALVPGGRLAAEVVNNYEYGGGLNAISSPALDVAVKLYKVGENIVKAANPPPSGRGIKPDDRLIRALDQALEAGQSATGSPTLPAYWIIRSTLKAAR